MAYSRHLKLGMDRPDLTPGSQRHSALGLALLRRGLVSSRRLSQLEAQSLSREVRLADSVRLSLSIPPEALAEAEAEACDALFVDPIKTPPDGRLISAIDPETCVKYGLLPWRRMGGTTVILTCRPEQFVRHQKVLSALFGPISMAIGTEKAIATAMKRSADRKLIHSAETRVPVQESCRNWNSRAAFNVGLATMIGCMVWIILSPVTAFAALVGWAVVTLTLSSLLKLAALFFFLKRPQQISQNRPATPARLPTVSILVPLFKERAIASHLIQRLEKIDYPRDLLDVNIVLEHDDLTTRNTLAATDLPHWIRPVVVPPGMLKTKPRALNYALDFARGSIIGVYDAEDAPDPQQIKTVISRFAQRDRKVACLQGVLDFYNSNTNWLSRCFTLEYAVWFRIMLPGLERLGLALPLGGTTLFFRRDVLEELGGWDAHNVTEDADLGIRLARYGYRTEMIPTITQEEANCRAWPWVKQRSRWLKGYAITYGVHMRNPIQLWRDLGTWKFFGVQLLFGGTLSQFVLAPALWSFWLVFFGLPHPLTGMIPNGWLVSLGILFFCSEVLNITTAMLAASHAGKPKVMFWAPTLHVYFPLATLASYKGLWELATRPFYWDKTAHGVEMAKKPIRWLRRPPRPDANG
ncbi:glycosyltransferase family 2 protein [Aestuariibius sp. HNIBRBA575]|uniref:glycosyltransferase family 2 protein n=1 Tax=Aestuariibius sp. HNIBRBA575 TaxID=3233343 RepID=UPI0034A202BC